MHRARYRASWLSALPFALVISLLTFSIFSYWFAVADRYRLFLYYHDMGPLVPDTSPFSRVAASRYWMSGFVWAGGLMVFYGAFNWLAGRISASYKAPAWWQVWILCALLLILGLPLITMKVNQPALPAGIAAQVTLATLVGLALAMMPGRMAAERPTDLLSLFVDGIALMLLLTAAIGVERIGQMSLSGRGYGIALATVSMIAGVTVLLIMTVIRQWRRWPMPSWDELLVAGLCIAYLLMPLVHHLGFTDGYYYISDSDNFFARSALPQIAMWLALILLAVGTSWIRARARLPWEVPARGQPSL